MEVERSLTIDEIFQKVKGYDLVLTAEVSLADALNNRIENPRVGKLAYTPKTLVYRRFQNRELKSEKELFLETIRNTSLSWKEASHLLREIIRFWEETGSLEGVLEGIKFDRKKARSVLQIVGDRNSIYREVEDFRLPEDRDICVVGRYQFNDLDLSVLPESYDQVGLFENERRSLVPFQVYDSASQLVGATLDNILQLEEEETAVVVHPESIYDPLLRSYLRQAEIEFQATEQLQDSESLRTLVQLLTLALRPSRVKLKEAEPVFNQLGVPTPPEREEEYLGKTDLPEMAELAELIQGSGDRTFGEVVGTLEEKGLQVEEDLKGTFRDLDLWESPIDPGKLNDLKYYLDSFSLEREQSHKGLLLVNPGAVAYIDRPVVFYLGMTTQWDLNVEERPWRDLQQARIRNLNNFKALLQNGQEQLYMVQCKRMNRPVTPSTYFNELCPEITSFTDGEEGEDFVLRDRVGPEESTFSSDHVTIKPEPASTISQSGLNTLVYCPRDYFFTRLVEEPDRDYFRKGTVFHEFAEFYAVHPQFVEEKGMETFLDAMVERMKPIVEEVELPALRTEFRLGIRVLKQYFRDQEIPGRAEKGSQGYEPGEGENFLARKFGRKINRKFTEMFFLDQELGAHGKVDLLAGNEIIDFKTGSRNTAGHIVRNSNVDLFEGKPDFQALLYLAHHRRFFPGEELKFTFLHVLEELGNLLSGEVELDDYFTTVTYYPWTFSEYLPRGEVYDYLNDSTTREKLLEPLGRENFLQVVSSLDLSPGDFYSREAAVSHREEFENLCRDHLDVGRGKDLTEKQLKKATGSILRTSLYKLRTENYFKEDVENFEEFLTETLSDLNAWRGTRFPVGDSDLKEVTCSDLILAGEGR